MGADDTLLEEIRERHEYAAAAWAKIREEAATDMRYVSGRPWKDEDKRTREAAGRPTLAMDELGQYINQVVNDAKANPIGMKFDPGGNGANPAGAEFYEGKAREIEYRSHAQMAYTIAFDNCVCQSYGLVRVNTNYESDRSVNQDFSIDPVVDPMSALGDPDFIRPDGSDMKFTFIREQRKKGEFKREFPKATITDFGPEAMAVAKQWISADKVQIAEYWKTIATDRELLMVGVPGQDDPRPMFRDELGDQPLPAGHEVKRTRTVKQTSVMQYLTNGLEILSRTPRKGKYLPFSWCFGKILYVDEGAGTQRQILSMVRLARDPYMLYCYYRSCEAELVGMTPKFPYFVYEGQLSPDELLNLQKSLHEPMAVIQVRPTVMGAPTNTVLSFPQRQPYEPPIQGLEAGAEAARRGIQAAMGISPLPTEAQRHNQKSGVALQQIESSGQRGAFHFTDSYKNMIRHVAEILQDEMGHVFDTARNTGILKPNGTAQNVRVNDPNATDEQGQPAHISTEGDYNVTISTAPAEASQRAAAVTYAESLLQTPFAPRIIDLITKLALSGPIADEIADRLTPPEFKKQPGQDPVQAPQQLAHALQMIDQLTKELNAKNDLIKTETIKAQAHKDEAIEVQKVRNAGAIAVAEVNARAKGVQSANEAQVDALALLQDSTEQEADRQHEAHMAGAGADVASAQADDAHDHTLEQGDAAAGNQMAIQAAAPQPDAGAGASA
jgi:portal protein